MRLTMGGEPTFVSLDDRDGAEWTTDRPGPGQAAARGRAVAQAARPFRPGALLHFGQGKWYPGEPLPRWALGCYWRKDGVPIWEEPTPDRRGRQGLRLHASTMRAAFSKP